MRKLLLVLFLYSLASNALAEDDRWSLVSFDLSCVGNDCDLTRAYSTFLFDNKKECEIFLLELQEETGGDLLRNIDNQLTLVKGNAIYKHIKVCTHAMEIPEEWKKDNKN
jgi:hypothetical protein